MPQVLRNLPYLKVYSHPWIKGRQFRDKTGKIRVVNVYEEARQYARENGFQGIQVTGNPV